jgi:hypothetical protein
MPNIPHPSKELLDALAASGNPDPGPPAPGLIEEAFPAVVADTASAALAGTMAAGPAVGIVAGSFAAMKGITDAAETKGSISQYLIASGGAQQSDTAPMNAILSAINRLAGFKSRL